MDVVWNMNFALSSNNKNKLREFYIDLIEELITATNTADYALELNSRIKKQESQTKSHNIDQLSSAIIPSKAVDSNQEYLAAIRYNNMSLVSSEKEVIRRLYLYQFLWKVFVFIWER